jgi:hypothetical protein
LKNVSLVYALFEPLLVAVRVCVCGSLSASRIVPSTHLWWKPLAIDDHRTTNFDCMLAQHMSSAA